MTCRTIARFTVAILIAATPAWRDTFAEDKPNVTAVSPIELYDCRFTEDSIEIDGKADMAWKKAATIENFSRRPENATQAKLLWDRKFLYVFAEMDDADLFAKTDQREENSWKNDAFEMFLKPAVDRPAYYEFLGTAAGTQFELFLSRRGESQPITTTGMLGIDSAVALRGTLSKKTDRDKGWSVELRIPWLSLIRTGGRPEPGDEWRFALCRYDHSADRETPDLSTNVSLDPKFRADFHAHENYAAIRFNGLQSRTATGLLGVDKFQPVTTSKVVGSPDPPLPYRATKAYPQLQLDFPVAARHIPGSDHLLFLSETSAYSPTRLMRMKDDPDVKDFEMLLDHDGSVAYDLCFHPDYLNNGYVYIGSNGPGPGDKKHSRVTRYHLDPKEPHSFDADSATVIIEWPSAGHNGAAIAFGPDRMLYVTSGDGTSDSDTDGVGQRLDLLRSKLLRIDVDHPAKGRMYGVPQDNPFVGRKNARTETWAYGFRNPWRIAIDQQNGNVWVGNNGQDLYEQVYLVRRGGNYGWSVYEGSHLFYPNRQLGPTPVTMPIFEHHHTESRSLTGGVIYRGEQLPELHGAYIYGDHSTGKIWGALHDGDDVVWHKELADTPLNITGFAIDTHGELLVLDHQGDGQGNFYRLEPTQEDVGGERFPTKLSETGLFRSVAQHELEPTLISYSVNVPHWADGAFGVRYLALPASDPGITFQNPAAWTFPDETVLVKSLALEMNAGDPKSRRWIETQLLTRQQDEWVGYSYAWNDEGTDAILVDRDGVDRTFEIETEGGLHKQVWHFASRSECMSCHSRAAGHVLGMTVLQMNRQHEDAGERDDNNVADNQLRTLEQLGVLRVDWYAGAKAALGKRFRAAGMSDSEAKQRVRSLTATASRQTEKKSTLLSRSPDTLNQLVALDGQQPVDRRVRSYLHANCAHCHIHSGGGNAQIQLSFNTPSDRMKLIGVPPVHATFDLPGARLVAPGDPYRSVLYYRLSTVGGGRMPRIGSHVVDKKAAAMIRDWIQQMPPSADDNNEEEQRIRHARQKERNIVSALSNTSTGLKTSADVDKLLESTSGALELLDACEDGRFTAETHERIVSKATSHRHVQTRDLFERFLSPEERVERLGTKVDAARILALRGDADRGRILFANGTIANCKSCHRFGDESKLDGPVLVGPNLAEIGSKLKREELLESILHPSRKIDEKFQAYLILTMDGRAHSGLIVKQDDNHIVLLGSDNTEKRLARENIGDIIPSRVSLMPEGLYRDMTAEQLADLLALLESAKKR